MSRLQVLNVIRANRVISRSALAGEVNISRATVSGVVSELIKIGLVVEEGLGQSTGGRPPVKLRYRPNRKLAIGAVLVDGKIRTALTDMEGSPIDFLETSASEDTLEFALQSVERAVGHLLQKVSRNRVMGVGVGIPGVVDVETGMFESSVSKGWLERGANVKHILESKLHLPVYTANRSRVAALGEYQVGIGQDVSTLIYLFVGQGIAAGIVIDGRLYLGPGSNAGEIGHVSVELDGPLCGCGNRGCLEVYATEASILARARASARKHTDSIMQTMVKGQLEWLTIEHIITATRQGDRPARQVLNEVGAKLGVAVANLINLFNPEMVIIGGPIGSEAGELLLNPVIKEAQLRTLSRPFSMTNIVNGTLGTHAVEIGAAVLAINHTPVDTLFETADAV